MTPIAVELLTELVAKLGADLGAGAEEPTAAPWLLDVREPWEFELAVIRLSGTETRLIPMGEIVERISELDPRRPVVCICHHGIRSAQVAAFLTRNGFDAVYNLTGGIDAWSQRVDPSVACY